MRPPLMFTFLRIIRGIFGLSCGSQVVKLLLSIAHLMRGQKAVTEEIVVQVFLIAIFAALFISMRWAINRLHIWRFGKPHPALHAIWRL